MKVNKSLFLFLGLSLLTSGAKATTEPNQNPENYCTEYCDCCYYAECPECAKYEKNVNKLLHGTFEIYSQGYYNRVTTLMCAVMTGNREMVTLLLELGADPNVKDSYGNTALMHAKRTRMTQLLLKYSAKANTKNKKGKTPLMRAIELRNIGIIKALLKNKARTKSKNAHGTSAYDLAYKIKDYQLRNTILDLLNNYR